MNRGALPPRSSRIGLFGYFSSGNLGNDASLEAVLGWLRRDYEDGDLCCICREPAQVRRQFGINSVRMVVSSGSDESGRSTTRFIRVVGKLLDPLWMYRIVKRLDVVIVPGMGVLEEQIGVRPWGLPYALVCLAVSCRLTGARLVLMSVGAEPIRNPVTRRFMTWTTKLADFCSYRDRYSRDAMIGNGARKASPVVPDVVFGLPDLVVAAEPKVTAVGVMAYFGPTGDRERYEAVHEAYLARMVDFVEWLRARGRVVRLVIGDVADRATAEAIVSRCAPGDAQRASLEISPVSTQRELETVLADSELIVASRYHNVVSAIRLGIPTVSLGYGVKNDELMSEAALDGMCRHIESWDTPWLAGRCEELEARRPDVIAQLADYRSRARSRLDAQYAEVGALVETACAGTGSAVWAGRRSRQANRRNTGRTARPPR